MKVILLRDVAKIGRRSEVVTVPDGYAMNHLIPQGAAEPATKENLKRLEARRSTQAAHDSAAATAFSEAVALLDGTTVTLAMNANDKGNLFEAVKTEQVAEALTAKGHHVQPEQVVLDSEIKEVGTYPITITDGVSTATLQLTIEAA